MSKRGNNKKKPGRVQNQKPKSLPETLKAGGERGSGKAYYPPSAVKKPLTSKPPSPPKGGNDGNNG